MLLLFNHYIKEIMDMPLKNGFNEKISALESLLQSEKCDPIKLEEISYLHENFSSWITLFELTGLLWEYRFNTFLRELLVLSTDGNIDELRTLAREFYLNGKNAYDASKEYKLITKKRRKKFNDSLETTSEDTFIIE